VQVRREGESLTVMLNAEIFAVDDDDEADGDSNRQPRYPATGRVSLRLPKKIPCIFLQYLEKQSILNIIPILREQQAQTSLPPPRGVEEPPESVVKTRRKILVLTSRKSIFPSKTTIIVAFRVVQSAIVAAHAAPGEKMANTPTFDPK